MHRLLSLFSFCFCSSRSFQISSQCMLYIHCFHLYLWSSKSFINTIRMHSLETQFYFLSALPNRFNYRQNAYFRDIVFKGFSALPNRFKSRHNAFLKRHCFNFFLCSSNAFQIPSECMLWRHCCQKISEVTNLFKQCLNACLRDIAPGSYTSRTSDLIIW